MGYFDCTRYDGIGIDAETTVGLACALVLFFMDAPQKSTLRFDPVLLRIWSVFGFGRTSVSRAVTPPPINPSLLAINSPFRDLPPSFLLRRRCWYRLFSFTLLQPCKRPHPGRNAGVLHGPPL